MIIIDFAESFLAFIFREMPFFSRSISEKVIQFFASLHSPFEVLLRSIILQICEKFVNCPHGDSQGRNRINHAVIAIILECINVNVRSFSELGHVRQ